MEWFKMVARFYEDDAIDVIGPAAEALFVRSIGYSTDRETNGFIAASSVLRFGRRGSLKLIPVLVREGLWTETAGGWKITNYERIQAEIVRIVKRREADKARKRAERSADVSADSDSDVPQDASLSLGYVSSSGVETEKSEDPPNPRQRGGRRCTRHARKRRGCADCDLPAVAVLPEPCGDCSPSRYLEDEAGRPVRPCPKCHPKGMTA